ncbi:type IV pilus biogenesis protein PilM [Tuwongella immobilis]|uniref:Competence protein A n=1 Tax=Tuwongella immobilis TaxID=692036 RepID=A0A6C2YSQ5_9BACT|nr:hypothetical protein [Tuwongella immobilis]VIP04404.1 Uncharacterized protein OS=Rhodopirellula baltica WH47 GN=RBWH47_03532 PE=4 SV=1 [Tuwongella immobilis]VTS06170.1 Uncharacterized protein OS=Rhodopirellula baltica WH47 GN=RBWH47_03532 PE=4 SV=1 [Tuwongella immobilis]
MARLLALEIDAGRMSLAVGSTTGTKVKVEQVLSWAEDAPLSLVNAVEIGTRLKQRLDSAKIAAAPLIVSIGRDRLLLKDVKHPPVPPHEQPALIRFQVVKDLTESPDDAIIDYSPTLQTATEHRALAVILKKEIQKAATLMADTAGLKLVATTPRMFGLVAALEEAIRNGSVSPPERNDGSVAILARTDRGGEFVVVRQGNIAMARAISTPALNSETALLNEVKRNLAVYSNQAAGQSITALYLTEQEGMPGAYTGRLREGLNIPVQGFDPIPGMGGIDIGTARGGYAGLTGLLTLRAAVSEMPINFAQPREPKPPKDPSLRLFAGLGVVMAAIVIGAVAWSFSTRVGLDRQIAELTDQKLQLDRELASLEQQGKRIKALDEWNNRSVVWLDEMYNLATHIKDVDKTRVQQFLGEPLPVTKNSDSKYVARMTLKVLTEDSRLVESMVASMVQDPHLRVAPKEPRGSTGIRSGRLNQQFGLRADLMYQAPDKFTQVLDAKRPGKPKRSGSSDEDGSGGGGIFGGMFNPFGGR